MLSTWAQAKSQPGPSSLVPDVQHCVSLRIRACQSCTVSVGSPLLCHTSFFLGSQKQACPCLGSLSKPEMANSLVTSMATQQTLKWANPAPSRCYCQMHMAANAAKHKGLQHPETNRRSDLNLHSSSQGESAAAAPSKLLTFKNRWATTASTVPQQGIYGEWRNPTTVAPKVDA